MGIVFLGLGTNLGDRKQNMAKAIKALEEKGIHILKLSSIIETEPSGGPPQGRYLNAVIKAETEFSPTQLLTQIKNIEKDMGRVKTVKNGPRIIDIDILLFNNLKMSSDALTIPHPRMLEREFVLGPLKEIEPQIKIK